MVLRWWKRLPKKPLLGVCAAVLVQTGVGRAEDNSTDLRTLVEQQNKQIQQLKERLDAVTSAPPAKDAAAAPANNPGDPAKAALDEEAVKKIVTDYLKANPGAGMPPSVQTGYELGNGFVIRSAPNPSYVKWDDESKIPFELRFRGRLQLDYYNYHVTDATNHLMNTPNATQNKNAVRQADESVLEVKRLRLIWEGTAFDPNLRYHFELDGNTRGLGGTQNNKVLQTASGTVDPNTSAASPIGGGVTVDNSVRLFSAWLAYDFHGCSKDIGCGPDCPEGGVKYAPTYTLIAGKFKPFMSFEEYMGSGNQQMVEYAMTEWYFDADDDNLLMGAGTQIRAAEDRFYLQAIITNGSESQFPATQMDDLPGFNVGFWYDFGGTWNNQSKKWDLYGDSWSDYQYSCNPVLRVGGATNLVPFDRRSLYGDDEESRIYVSPGGPQGGTRLINLFDGGTTTTGSHAVDDFNEYTFETFGSLHYKGFSLTNDWFCHILDEFRTTPNGKGQIIYTDGTGSNALLPIGKSLFDYGMVLQAGYFVVPKKWEVVGRWSFISGDSGDLNGNGKFTTETIAGVGPVHVIDGAFTNFHLASEYAIGVNRYWKGQLLKWSTDFSIYDGGNPAGGGQSPAGFIAGSDGWMLRTQLQIAF
ncbi:MAG TPA: hypothetical protein VK395_30760 [Gemmataceae bacterium]|nr:hypothetical protein [Gemmataceae bacterium]